MVVRRRDKLLQLIEETERSDARLRDLMVFLRKINNKSIRDVLNQVFALFLGYFYFYFYFIFLFLIYFFLFVLCFFFLFCFVCYQKKKWERNRFLNEKREKKKGGKK